METWGTNDASTERQRERVGQKVSNARRSPTPTSPPHPSPRRPACPLCARPFCLAVARVWWTQTKERRLSPPESTSHLSEGAVKVPVQGPGPRSRSRVLVPEAFRSNKRFCTFAVFGRLLRLSGVGHVTTSGSCSLVSWIPAALLAPSGSTSSGWRSNR